jgi:hypothetical protein
MLYYRSERYIYSSVSVVTRLRATQPRNRDSIPGRDQEIILISTASRPGLGRTQLPFQSALGLRKLGHEADHSPPSTKSRAVSRRLTTRRSGIRSQVRLCGIFGGPIGIGAGFLRVLRLPLPILISPTAPHLLIILSPTLYSIDTDSIVK